MAHKKDCLIIRNKIDWVTDFTNWMGEGLKEELERRKWPVVDLSGPEATPSNVSYWLQSGDRKISRLIIDFDHGYPEKLVGQQGKDEVTIIDRGNAESLTKNLDVYTFACSTGKRGGLGEYAVAHGCRSWLGYTDTIYWDPFIAKDFKKCVWSYALAMADGLPARSCYETLVDAYQRLADDSMICEWNLSKLAFYNNRIL